MSLTKFERIRLVRQMGLNTQDDILVTAEEDWRAHRPWLDQFDAYTVRTFPREGSKGGAEPSFEIITRKEFDNHWRRLLAEGWNLIIAEPIDPKDAALAGAILRDGDWTEVEIVRGSGSIVRQVTHKGQVDERFRVQVGDWTTDFMIDDALAKIWEAERKRPHLVALKSVIYEFSWYLPKVGYKRENAIFWEITGRDRMNPGINPEEIG